MSVKRGKRGEALSAALAVLEMTVPADYPKGLFRS